MQADHPRTSDMLAGVLGAHPEERIRVGDLVAGLRNRVFGLTFLVFGIPNCIPMPPGVPVICGIVLGFVAAQLALGRDFPWLPARVADKTFPRSVLVSIVERAVPIIRKFERLSRPRLDVLVTSGARRAIGAIIVLLAGILILPIPFLGNMPPGIAICIFGLALIERDGLFALGGYVATVLGLAVTVGMTWAIFAGAAQIF